MPGNSSPVYSIVWKTLNEWNFNGTGIAFRIFISN